MSGRPTEQARGAAWWRLHVYRCPWCRCWHVGHRKAPKGKT